MHFFGQKYKNDKNVTKSLASGENWTENVEVFQIEKNKNNSNLTKNRKTTGGKKNKTNEKPNKK